MVSALTIFKWGEKSVALPTRLRVCASAVLAAALAAQPAGKTGRTGNGSGNEEQI